MESGWKVLFYISGAKFPKIVRSTTLNTKNQIIFDSFEKSYKIENYQNQIIHQNL